MSWNPFGATSTYKEMLAKIAICNFVSATGGLSLLSYHIPDINSFFRQWPMKIPVGGLEVPSAIIVSSMVIAIVARIIKLHDRLSDILGLRRRFDVTHILSPLAKSVGVTVDESVLKKHRRDLMRQVFYRYASSENPVIDRHYVIMALDQWCWFWVLTESIPIWFAVGIALAVYRQLVAVCLVGTGLVGALFILAWSWKSSIRYAKEQINVILSDEQRRKEIVGALSSQRA